MTNVTYGCKLVDASTTPAEESRTLRCGDAALYLAKPGFEQYTLKRTLDVHYIYYAPNGKAVYKGEASQKHKGTGNPLKVGDVIKISVNRYNTKESIPMLSI